jgi:hypothetical protein
MIGLTEVERCAEALRMGAAARLDLRKAFGAVGALGVLSVKIGVGAIEEKNARLCHVLRSAGLGQIWSVHQKHGRQQ